MYSLALKNAKAHSLYHFNAFLEMVYLNNISKLNYLFMENCLMFVIFNL